jgi:3-hydroxyisobutyrate dehydrogenase-like beta-hydroxyacid dehydrogenase
MGPQLRPVRRLRGATVIGLLHPGAMGAAVGAALVDAGQEVGWASDGRGAETHARAAIAGLIDLGTTTAMADSCDLIVSICPPESAVNIAEAISAQNYHGTYVDANAISPATAQRVADIIAAGGGDHVDGCIIGLPPIGPGVTRLYLSGRGAETTAERLKNDLFEVVTLSGVDHNQTSASGLKMVYAAWTKISSALLISTVETARRIGVEDVLRAEWDRSQPAALSRYLAAEEAALEKGWRWAYEMAQIAATFTAVDSPAGFGVAASEVFANYTKPSTSPQSSEARR